LREFDVVVLGAGIAGLLVASELAQRRRVLVLEKANRIPETKYWLTDAACVAANTHLAEAVDCQYDAIDFIAHDDLTYRCRGAYRLWNTSRLLAMLRSRIVNAGSEIECGTTFYSYSTDRNGVVVRANDRQIRAGVLVDCMGVGSPILYAEDAIRIDGYYLLHGASFRRVADIPPVAFHNLMLSDHPAYVEAFPTPDGRLHIILISAVRDLKPHSSLAADFTFVCTKSPYARYIDSAASAERRFLGGIVPVGRMRRRAVDRVVFFGEAGQANPPASATGLTKMLYGYKSFSAAIDGCLQAGTLDRASLEHATTPLVDPLNAAVQRALFRAMLRWRSGNFREVIAELNRLDDHAFGNDMIFATIAAGSVLPYARKLLRARAYTLLRTLAAGMLPRFTAAKT
jgi:flavin-dependent dehydrogenase